MLENVGRVREAVISLLCWTSLSCSKPFRQRFLPHSTWWPHILSVQDSDRATTARYIKSHACVAQHLEYISRYSLHITSDEAHVHLFCYFSKQNFWYWSDEWPAQVYKIPLHSAKVTVCCGVSPFAIIRADFVEEGYHSLTVTLEQ